MLKKIFYICAMMSFVSLSGYSETFDACPDCLACKDCFACDCKDHDKHLLAHHGEEGHDHETDGDEEVKNVA